MRSQRDWGPDIISEAVEVHSLHLTFSSRPVELALLPQPPQDELEQRQDGSVRFRTEHLGAEVCAVYELYRYTKMMLLEPKVRAGCVRFFSLISKELKVKHHAGLQKKQDNFNLEISNDTLQRLAVDHVSESSPEL